jgi:hypothetical protein
MSGSKNVALPFARPARHGFHARPVNMVSKTTPIDNMAVAALSDERVVF